MKLTKIAMAIMILLGPASLFAQTSTTNTTNPTAMYDMRFDAILTAFITKPASLPDVQPATPEPTALHMVSTNSAKSPEFLLVSLPKLRTATGPATNNFAVSATNKLQKQNGAL